MKPLTATLNMRFVAAAYLALRMFSGALTTSAGAGMDKVRRTSGDNSLSTRRAWRAMDASLAVGRGTSTVLYSDAISV